MKPLKIVFSAIDSQGHINACIAIAQLLAPRGHEIIFAVTSGWKELVEKHNFKFIEVVIDEWEDDDKIIDENGKDAIEGSNDININNKDGKSNDIDESVNIKNSHAKLKRPPNAFLLDYISTMFSEVRLKTMDRFKYYDEKWAYLNCKFCATMGAINDPLSKILDTVKPDLVIVDTLFKLPCLMKTNIPWISLWSCNPLLIYNDGLPPFGTGLPTRGPKSQWEEFESINNEKYKPVLEHNRRWLAKKGITDTDQRVPKYHLLESPFLNIYNYPEILDYCDISKKPSKWFRVDSAVREPDENVPFVIPEKLANKPGKLIYFSLGSMGSIDLDLMKRVIRCLAKSPHRFIVSKGPHHEQIDLPNNMWGERYVNQIAILPHVDLVITHGGNNTLTESLYFGKPVIVMPLFFDQPDNAQRIAEKGLGLYIETYHFKDEELLEGIEKILKDDEIYIKLEDVRTQLMKSNTREEMCQLIEKTAILKKCPL